MNFYERIQNDDFLKKLSTQEGFIDETTGVISRRYILKYINNLVNQEVPFTMYIMDIDNFKLVNDRYGHNIGDQVLNAFGNAVREYMAPYGVVGRYGGDEFIVVNFETIDYEDIRQFLFNMYMSESVIRHEYLLGKYKFNITATIGTATFPRDAFDYNELFIKADKALYRGKTKGRNCFIIYVEEKHKDIDINDMHKNTVASIMNNVASLFKPGIPIDSAIEYGLRIIQDSLGITMAFYMNPDGKMISSIHKGVLQLELSTVAMVEKFIGGNEIIELSNLSKKPVERTKIIGDFLSNNIEALLFKKVRFGERYLGTVGFFTMNDNRIWQADDLATLTFIEKLIGMAKLHNLE